MIYINLGFNKLFKTMRSVLDSFTGDSITLDQLIADLSSQNVDPYSFLNIPTLSGCVNLISGTIASLPLKLYSSEGDQVKTLEDPRVRLLNDNTGDELDGFQFKQALISDFLLMGEGYAYINRRMNNITGLYYVKNQHVSVNKNHDPVFKKYSIIINGQTYQPYQFIRLLRRTKDGAEGTGILSENYEALKAAFNALKYENLLVSSGGNKKGFIKSQGRLSPDAVAELKTQWNNMYSNNNSNCVVLNNGLDFQESSNTSVEMQLNENKKTNAIEICKMFNIPEGILNGTCSEEQYQTFIKITILPILAQFETALNNALLTNTEKTTHYFKFDTKELLKGDIVKRMTAYEIAVRSGIMQLDEIRFIEDLSPLDLNFIKLGLQDVLYDPVKKQIYTPNTNQTADIGNLKGGDKVEN